MYPSCFRWNHLGWNHIEHHPHIWAWAGNSIWYTSNNGIDFHYRLFNVQHHFSQEKVRSIISTEMVIILWQNSSCYSFFHRIVKISSPSLNYFIILGAFLMYSSIYFFLVPSLNPVVVLTGCLVSWIQYHVLSKLTVFYYQLELWLFTVGYSLAYGAVLAKMWRVYQIFSNPKPKKRVSATLYSGKFRQIPF